VTVITGEDLLAALGINRHVSEYEFTDSFGVHYSGAASHLVLAALVRSDVTHYLYPEAPEARRKVRRVARLLTEWFTCRYIDPTHARAFAAMFPSETCDLIAFVANHGDPDVLSKVGPQSVGIYTTYLLGDRTDPVSFPTVVDAPYCSLVDLDTQPGALLQITSTGPDGAEDVEVAVRVEANQTRSWSFKAQITVPTERVNALLMAPRAALAEYIEEERDQVDEHLDDSGSDGLNVTSAQLLVPRTKGDVA
jgi:hypothetical protein